MTERPWAWPRKMYVPSSEYARQLVLPGTLETYAVEESCTLRDSASVAHSFAHTCTLPRWGLTLSHTYTNVSPWTFNCEYPWDRTTLLSLLTSISCVGCFTGSFFCVLCSSLADISSQVLSSRAETTSNQTQHIIYRFVFIFPGYSWQ